MEEELEQLQKIGAQKIYEKTHIPRLSVQAILDGSYDKLSRIKFLGFLSILERDYELKLSNLKADGLAYFDSLEQNVQSPVDDNVLVTTNKSAKKSFLIVSIFIIVIVGVFYIFTTADKKREVKVEDSVQMEKLKKRAAEIRAELDENITKEVAKKEEKEIKQIVPTEQIVQKSIKITTQSKVWFGYIDMKKKKKYQKTFTGELELSLKRDWLFLFGHGYIKIYVDGKLQEFPTHPIHFLYKDGNLTSISPEEFQELNGGKIW